MINAFDNVLSKIVVGIFFLLNDRTETRINSCMDGCSCVDGFSQCHQSNLLFFANYFLYLFLMPHNMRTNYFVQEWFAALLEILI